MRPHPATLAVVTLIAAASASVGYLAYRAAQQNAAQADRGRGGPVAVAVEVAPVRSGPINDARVISGTIEASSQFVVAAEAPGLLRQLHVDLADEIQRGQAIGSLDDRQALQALAQAQAELAVRNAELTRAETRLAAAAVEYGREKTLRDQGVSSQSMFDQSFTTLQAAEADRAVALARVEQAAAALALAQIRLQETRITADWADGPDHAVIGERHQDVGNTLAAGDPIVTVVALDPLRAVIFVTERDYTRLSVGQPVELRTDAVPDLAFTGSISRIAPVFREASRQARVEIDVPNPRLLLRPGMFARARIVLQTRQARALVPLEALATRDGGQVVFLVEPTEPTDTTEPVSPEFDPALAARLVPVTTGIIEDGSVEILDPFISGRVVTLGQQLLDHGSPVNVVDDRPTPALGLGHPDGLIQDTQRP